MERNVLYLRLEGARLWRELERVDRLGQVLLRAEHIVAAGVEVRLLVHTLATKTDNTEAALLHVDALARRLGDDAVDVVVEAFLKFFIALGTSALFTLVDSPMHGFSCTTSTTSSTFLLMPSTSTLSPSSRRDASFGF